MKTTPHLPLAAHLSRAKPCARASEQYRLLSTARTVRSLAEACPERSRRAREDRPLPRSPLATSRSPFATSRSPLAVTRSPRGGAA